MVYLVLDDIRSVYNTASIFRTADAIGVEKIYLCGTTPAPVDRFGRKRSDFAKVSLGAEESVPWEFIEKISDALVSLEARGVAIVAVEQTEESLNYRTFDPREHDDVAYVFGSETEGISKGVLDKADVVLEIPMRGKKESLNVAVTAGIILFCSGSHTT